jgi:hypothetical protein
VFKSSGNKYWFDCECGHQFDSALCSITVMNCWCPYCAHQKLCEKKDCPSCLENSFALHEKSKYWSDKNGDVKPRQVFKSSGNKYWFDCECGHQFDSALRDITSLNLAWCPYCANPSNLLCDKVDCQTCFNKSFASHEKSKYWSDKNDDVKPRQAFKSSGKKYWFNCDKCNHEFESALYKINVMNRWCPYCANQKLCEKKDCPSCLENSFALHENQNIGVKKMGM